MPPRPRLTLPAILLYERADTATGWIFLCLVVFSPWAFGTTNPWAIGVMNLAGYALGLLLAAKLWIRHGLGHQPARWDNPAPGAPRRRSALTWGLAAVTALLLLYCALAAVNARADYDPQKLTLSYRHYLGWLPHSYHRVQTWRVFFNYLAWAASFWALRDWLLGMTAEESRQARDQGTLTSARLEIPTRLRTLLWVLAVNGAVLGIEGVIQRLAGTDKLLFLLEPRVNQGAMSQFGPYAYRSNAAQYLNLVWPVALGFWWWLQRTAARTSAGRGRHWLLGCAAIMAACPIISTSRAGALTAMILLAFAVAVLITGHRGDGLVKLAVLGVFGLALAGGTYFGWGSLSPRLNELTEGYNLRETMFATARVIARENAVFGTGPGTFEHIFQLYRQSTTEYWPAQLHNDWLELLLTFGWVGFGLILLALVLALAHWPCAAGVAGVGASKRFVWMLWLALAGCLLQARWDFPFQIYSIVWLFLLLASLLTLLTRKP